jgi:hypothetical protein
MVTEKDIGWWHKLDGRQLIGPGEHEAFDFHCQWRVGPAYAKCFDGQIPVLEAPGAHDVAVACYSSLLEGWREPPLLVSATACVEVRHPTSAEGDIGQRLCDAYVKLSELDRDYRRTLTRLGDDFRKFLDAQVDSPVNDDVRYLQSKLLMMSANPTADRHDYDYDLLWERYDNLYAIPPRRAILYRQVVNPPFMTLLARSKLQDRIDVPAWLDRLTQHPPFPDRPEFASRRRWLDREISKVEASIELKKRRPLDPSKRVG